MRRNPSSSKASAVCPGSRYPWHTASPRNRTSPATIRISIPSGGRPSVVASSSGVSSGAPMVIMGTSVMPYPWVSRTPISRTTAWYSSGGFGAPPPASSRSVGTTGVPGRFRCSARNIE